MISVIMPVYNAGPSLRLAIESILRQSYRDFEFIIIDDASSDDSFAIISEYAEQDPRIKVVRHQQNAGVAATLNQGLQIADADLVVRMDADDESLAERLMVQHQYMHTHPEIAVAGSFVYHMGASRGQDHLRILPTAYAEIRQQLFSENCIYHPTVIMRKQKILGLGGYRQAFKNSEDYDLWLRISRHYPMANIAKPLLRYRFSVNGMTIAKKWQQFYYFNLALVANCRPELPLEKVTALTDEIFASYDRRQFLRQVYQYTLDELVLLGLRRDGLALLRQAIRDLGWLTGSSLLYYLFRSSANGHKPQQESCENDSDQRI